MNGIFELDWKLLGYSIANAVNSGIDFAYGFIHNFEWGRLGVGMGDALSEFFSTFDYNKLADSINEFVLGVYDIIKGFIVHLDTDELSTKIVEFLEILEYGCNEPVFTDVEGHIYVKDNAFITAQKRGI